MDQGVGQGWWGGGGGKETGEGETGEGDSSGNRSDQASQACTDTQRARAVFRNRDAGEYCVQGAMTKLTHGGKGQGLESYLYCRYLAHFLHRGNEYIPSTRFLHARAK